MKKDSFVEQLKTDIVLLLLEKMENMQLEPERASEIAKYVLSVLKGDVDDENVWEIIPKIDDDFPELAPVVSKYLKERESSQTQSSIDKIRSDIQGLVK